MFQYKSLFPTISLISAKILYRDKNLKSFEKLKSL